MRLGELNQWHKTPPGKWLLQFEQDQVSRWLSQVRDARVVQIGGLPDTLEIAKHNNPSYYFIGSHAEDVQYNQVDVVAQVEELPFVRNSIDLMIFVHVLEFAEHPTVVLKEAFDCLSPYGKLLFFCFNPWSYWGVHKLFANKRHYPWQGKYYSPARLQHWLSMIGFTHLKDKTFCFRAPFNKRPLTRSSYIVEALGQITFPMLGAVNAFLLEKRVLGAKPQPRIVWQEKKMVINPRGLEPTTRVNRVKIDE